MAAPQAQTQADRLIERVNALGRRHEVTEFEERSIRREIEAIGQNDCLAADMLTCELESLLGNRDAVAKAIERIEANGFLHDAGYGRFFFSAKFLQATKANEWLRYVFPHPTRSLHQSMDSLLLIGAYRSIVSFVEQAAAEKRAIKGVKMIPVAKEVVSILDRLQISDQQIAKIIDEAGEVLEAHGLHRTIDVPLFLIPSDVDDETPNGAIHIEYRVATTPETASEMNWELLDRIVDQNLDVAGLTVGFAGVR